MICTAWCQLDFSCIYVFIYEWLFTPFKKREEFNARTWTENSEWWGNGAFISHLADQNYGAERTNSVLFFFKERLWYVFIVKCMQSVWVPGRVNCQMFAISLGSRSERTLDGEKRGHASTHAFFLLFFFCRLKCTWRYNCIKKYLLPLAIFWHCEQKLEVNTCLWNCYCCLRATEAFSREIM